MDATIPTAPMAADPWGFATPPLLRILSLVTFVCFLRLLHVTLGHVNLAVRAGVHPRPR